MASILRQRLLRTGDLEFSATTASDVDQYLCVVDERISKTEMAELFVAVPGNPIPRQTLKPLGSGILICDKISCSQRPRQGYIWNVDVAWKELEDDNPNQQSRPTPNSDSVDPEDWAPTWQRRVVIVHEPAKKAFYIDGYSLTGPSSTFFTDSADPEGRCPIVNSALQPIVETPEHRRRIYIYTFRWLRAAVPPTLVDAEGRLNDRSFTVNLGGIDFEWRTRTALIDTVNLSKMKWGTTTLTEITVEVAHDPEGWEWKIPDKGTARRQAVGDPGVVGTLIDAGKPLQAAIKDANGKAIQDPVNLDGNGQPATSNLYVEGTWLDFQEEDFNNVGLLQDLSV